MAQRIVTAVRRDERGRIIAVGNPGEDWSPLSAGEAIADISLKVHSYIARGPSRNARIIVVYEDFGFQRYLRTVGDPTTDNNLDELRSLDQINPRTGGFDVVIDVDRSLLSAAIEAAYAADVLDHSATWAFEDALVAVRFDAPEVRPVYNSDPAEGSVTDVTTRLHCWVRRADDLTDTGWAAPATVKRRVRLSTRPPGGVGKGWVVELEDVPSADTTVSASEPDGVRRAFLERAIAAAILSEGTETWPVPIDRLGGPPNGLDLRFARKGSARRLQVGVAYTGPGEEFPEPEATAPWSIAIGRAYIARSVYQALATRLGAAPPPGGLAPVALGDGVMLDALMVSLDDAGLVLSGALHRDDPLVSATFRLTAAITLAPDRTLRVEFGTPSVTVSEWYARIADFFAAGAVTRAIEEGIKDALADQGGGQLAGFLSPALLDGLLSFGKSTAAGLTVTVQYVVVDHDALRLSGTITSPVTAGPIAEVHAFPLGDKKILLDAGDSWAPAGAIAAVRWAFGDGSITARTGAGTALIMSHEYAQAGPKVAQVDVTDRAGRTTKGVVSFTV